MDSARDASRNLFEKVLSPGGRSLGTELISFDVAERHVRLSFRPTEHCTNILGFIHGGYIAAMLDEAAGMAAKLALPVTKAVPTLNFNVTFLSPAPVARLIGDARVIKLGRSTAVLEARLLDEANKLLAQMSVTAAVIDIAR